MAEFAALPLFTDSLLADTGHLTHEEFGMYMRLLIITWRTPGCQIPDDAQWISKRLGIDPMRFNKIIQPILSEFFTLHDHVHMQKRLKKEYEYVKTVREKKSAAAKSRWEKDFDPCIRNAPTPTPTPTDSPLKPPQGGATDLVPVKQTKEKNDGSRKISAKAARQKSALEAAADAVKRQHRSA